MKSDANFPPPPAGNRGQVLALLRTGPLTVNDLAEALELTDNGVRAHLASLQAEGLVMAAGERAGVRKPHQLFGLTAAGRQLFPTADRPLLLQLLTSLSGAMPAKSVRSFLRKTGAALAEAHRGEFKDASREKRGRIALRILGELGGAAAIEKPAAPGDVTVIQGRHCPFSALVPEHPDVCAVAEGFLETVLDRPVSERCQKGAHPCCRFEVAAV